MSKRDYYEVLGVDKNANEADIKKAYRYLFRSDLNQSDALAKVKKELSNNYVDEILHFYESSERGII